MTQHRSGSEPHWPRGPIDSYTIVGVTMGLFVGGIVGATVAGVSGFVIGDIVGGLLGAAVASMVKRFLENRRTP